MYIKSVSFTLMSLLTLSHYLVPFDRQEKNFFYEMHNIAFLWQITHKIYMVGHSCPKHVVIEKKVQANLITKL